MVFTLKVGTGTISELVNHNLKDERSIGILLTLKDITMFKEHDNEEDERAVLSVSNFATVM